MKRILPCIAASFFVGVYCYDLVFGELFFTFAAALLFALILKRVLFYGNIKIVSLCLFACVCGFIFTWTFDAAGSKKAEPYIDQPITVYGKIAEIPQKYDHSTAFILKVFSADLGQGAGPADFKIRISIYEPKQTYAFGDVVKLDVTPRRFDAQQNEEGFNARTFYKARGLWCRGTARESGVTVLPDAHVSEFGDIGVFMRQRILDIFDRSIGGEPATFAKAILIGYRADMPQTLKDAFMMCGISHLVAVSGMHVGIVFLFVCAILQFITKNKRIVAVVGIFALLFFVLLTGISASVLRSAVMYILYLLAVIFRRQNDTPNILALAAIIVLLSNPFFAFDVGFLLTFSSTIGILWLCPHLMRLLRFLPYPLCTLLSVTLAATLMSLPILMYYFNYISLINVVCNIIFVPLLPAMMVVTALTALGGAIHPVLGDAFGWLARLLLSPSIDLIYRMSRLTYAAVVAIRPDAVMFVAYYLCMALLVRLRGKKRDRVFHAGGALVLLLVLCIVTKHVVSVRDLTVHFINVGQGDCALVRLPGGRSMLIDGGGTRTSPDYIGNNIVLPYLRKEGVTQVDYAVISHYDEDHSGGILTLLRAGCVKTVITPLPDPLHEVSNEIDALVAEKHVRRIVAVQGDRLDFGRDVIFEVLAPSPEGIGADSNDASLVGMLRYGETSFLFTGDIGAKTMAALDEQYDLKCDVLKIPHHGSKGSYHPAFYKEAAPAYAVISVGLYNTYGHPADQVLRGLSETGADVLRTDLNGNIKIRSDKKEILSVRALVGH